MTVNIKGKDRSIAVNMLCQQAYTEKLDMVDIQMEGDQKEVTEICNLWTDSFFYKKWIKAIKEGIDDIEKKSL